MYSLVLFIARTLLLHVATLAGMLHRLIRLLLQGSPVEEGQESFKKPRHEPRRSERLSQRVDNDVVKTPVVNKKHLPSPVTQFASEGTNEFSKETTATPPEGRLSQVAHNYSQALALSSPPQDTQPFSQTTVDPNAPLSEEVEDEVKEGVWGYLFPMDTRYGGTCVVLRKRGACPPPSTVADAVPAASKKSGRKGAKSLIKEQEAYDKKQSSSLASGGYLIGRHPECGKFGLRSI